MWKLLHIQAQDYLVNFEVEVDHSRLKILISNFENLWSAELSGNQLIDNFRIYNPVIELDKVTLIKEIEHIFTRNPKNVTWDIKIMSDQLKLYLNSILGNVPFKFEIDFHLVDNKTFFQTIVSPLLILMKGMQKQNEYLCHVIQMKDKEIAEYQLDGAVLSRKTVETPKFDDTVLNNMLSENLKTVSKENVSSLFDETFALYLGKINSLLCNQRTTNEENKCSHVENEKQMSSIQEPVKKKIVETVPKYEQSKEKTSKLEEPIIKKKPKVVKNLLNL